MSLLIADASPLIGLARSSSLHLLRYLYHNIVIPQVVFNELETSSNKPGSVILAKAIESDWLSVEPITGELPTTLLKTATNLRRDKSQFQSDNSYCPLVPTDGVSLARLPGA